MAHNVICKICGQTFDRDKVPFELVSARRYAHLECAEKHRQSLSEKDKLNEYIKELFKLEYVSPRIQKQIKNYIEEFNFTYSGILKTLIYYFEIKNGDISKANGGIGIVGYIYEEAKEYYRRIETANLKNIDVKIENNDLEIFITPKELKPLKKKKFSFLD